MTYFTSDQCAAWADLFDKAHAVVDLAQSLGTVTNTSFAMQLLRSALDNVTAVSSLPPARAGEQALRTQFTIWAKKQNNGEVDMLDVMSPDELEAAFDNWKLTLVTPKPEMNDTSCRLDALARTLALHAKISNDFHEMYRRELDEIRK